VIDVGLAQPRVERMSPAAVGLAVLLHVVIGLAIWWLADPRQEQATDEPIMVMFDSSPSNRGLQQPETAGPPAESTAANPQVPVEPPRQEEQQQQALAPPPATPVPTLPMFEFSIPPPPQAPPAPSTRDFLKPPAPRAPLRPTQRTLPLPTRPAPAAQQRPPTDSPATMPAPLPGPEPGDVRLGQGRLRNDYLTRVFRQLEPYRASAIAARGTHDSGRVVTRVTIGRDGGLIDVSIQTSSGRPALDTAELEAIRRAAPFPPVPGGMPGDPIVLHLPMTYNLGGWGR
jgi:protein TonB